LAVVGECLEVVTIPDFIPVGVALVVLAKKEVFRGGVIPVLPAQAAQSGQSHTYWLINPSIHKIINFGMFCFNIIMIRYMLAKNCSQIKKLYVPLF